MYVERPNAWLHDAAFFQYAYEVENKHCMSGRSPPSEEKAYNGRHLPAVKLQSGYRKEVVWIVWLRKKLANGETQETIAARVHGSHSLEWVNEHHNNPEELQGRDCDVGITMWCNLRSFWTKVRDRDVVWHKEILEREPENADGEYYLPHFHRFTRQCILDVLRVPQGRCDWPGKSEGTCPIDVDMSLMLVCLEVLG